MYCQHVDHNNFKIEGVCFQKDCNYNRAGCIICFRDFHNQHQFKMLHEIDNIRQKKYKFILDQLNILDEIQAEALNLKKLLSQLLLDLNQSIEDKNNTVLNKEVNMILLIEEFQSQNCFKIFEDIKQKLSILNEKDIIINQNCSPSMVDLNQIQFKSDNLQQDADNMITLNSILFTEKINKPILSKTQQIVESLKFINQQEYTKISSQQNFFSISDIAFGLILQYQSILQLMNQDLIMEDYERWVKLLTCVNFQMKTLSYQAGTFHTTLSTKIPQKKGEIIQVKELLLLKKTVIDEKFDIELKVISAKYYLNLFYLLPFQSFIVENHCQNKIILREIPQPRSSKMILWLGENPKKEELEIIQEIEQKNSEITVMFCLQNNDLKELFYRYKWLHCLNNHNLRIIAKLESKSQELELFLNTLFELIKYKEKIFLSRMPFSGPYYIKKYGNKVYFISKLADLQSILSFQ